MLLNLGLVATTVPGLSREARRRVFRESGTPMIPLELLSAVMAAAEVLLWARFGLVAVVGLLAVLVVTMLPQSAKNGNGPGLNARGHSLDACSITSSAHPP
jgi:hypothetical protein